MTFSDSTKQYHQRRALGMCGRHGCKARSGRASLCPTHLEEQRHRTASRTAVRKARLRHKAVELSAVGSVFRLPTGPSTDTDLDLFVRRSETNGILPANKFASAAVLIGPRAFPRTAANRGSREMGSPQAAHRTRAGAWLGAEGPQPQSPQRGLDAARVSPRKGTQNADRVSGARAKGRRTENVASRAGRPGLGGCDIAGKDNGAPAQTTRERTRQAGARVDSTSRQLQVGESARRVSEVSSAKATRQVAGGTSRRGSP